MDIIAYYILFYFIYSNLGWFMEVITIFTTQHTLVNRGFLVGPICPIYGTCALLMIGVLHFFIETPIVLFLMAILICSIAEYITSYFMEKIFGARWWDYSNKLFNLNGRICLANSLAFGLLGFCLIYFIQPFMWKVVTKIPIGIIYILVTIFLLIYIVDNIVSFRVILKLKKVTQFVRADNTKEISEKVKEILKNTSFLGKRLISAFPDLRVIIKDLGYKAQERIHKISNRGVK